MTSAARRWIVGTAAALILTAAGVRQHGLAERDLYCDEAQAALIAASFWTHGELNLFRYSRFLPDGFFRSGTIVYFPPLSYLVTAPFTALRDRVGANIAPRLPALLSGLLLIGLMIPAAHTILGDARVGVAAAALTVFNGFHIGMSRTALPYALLPVLLLLALLALLQALRRDRPADWIGAALSLTATAYVNQIALLFWPMIAPCAPAAQGRGALRRLIVCIGVAGGAFLLWVAALPRAAFFANSFFQTTVGYEFFAQLAKLAAPYQHMLAPWPVTVAFALGLARLSVETVRHRDDAKVALLVWLALPGAILLTRSMWIHDYHLYSVYPPVVLIAAYGADAAVRTVAVLLRQRHAESRQRDALLAAAIALLCWSEWRFVPPTAAPAALEFGDARIVSHAAAHIRRHDGGEAVIAPVGMAEGYYLERFVHSKNREGAVTHCLELVRRSPAWVFMGDNYFHSGRLDACDEFVRQHGTLVMHSAPIPGFTDSVNPLGYALYYLAAPDRRP